MKCKNVNKRLLFYLDNELTGNERNAIEAHLANCADCRKEIEALAATQGLLRQGFQALNTRTVPPWKWIEVERRLAVHGSTETSRLRGVMSRIRSFVSWQPSWKPVLSGILAITIILVSALLVPRVLQPPSEVMASEIARDDPEVRALANGEPSVQVTKVSDTTGYIVNQGLSGESNLAYVNLRSGTVVKVYRLIIPSLTAEDRTEITDIARSDPDIQQIMDRGGAIEGVYLLSYLLRLELINGEPAVWSEGILAGVTLREANQRWVARVSTGEDRVVDITGLPAVPFPTWPAEASVEKYSREKLVNIARSDTRVSALLDKGAEVAGVATGVRKMADSASVILKLGEEAWAVKIDLNTREVSGVEPVPAAKYEKTHFFKLER